jgi:hypothetical protein
MPSHGGTRTVNCIVIAEPDDTLLELLEAHCIWPLMYAQRHANRFRGSCSALVIAPCSWVGTDQDESYAWSRLTLAPYRGLHNLLDLEQNMRGQLRAHAAQAWPLLLDRRQCGLHRDLMTPAGTCLEMRRPKNDRDGV